ncbi:response regulator transcription factor [Acrocarpospora macrocephala]|uniref:HTH luxR-type domain-containing protein n=1 Tax=Acrocarpospora macrocephala TaxID=150177 RepID=A0A5M3WIP8_9ACTN|nr:helix-turn-helix transcriptional regulator [Acrocarpospora macrocephala]GES09037.1 hypothetical protein Amac_026330 [Acrocarpospora macrocephala]
MEVVTVHGDQELILRAGHLFEGVRDEFVCAAVDLDTWSRRPAPNRIPTGLPVRKLFTPAALIGEPDRLHLRQIASKGVRVRISSSPLPYETIIIDRRVMILAGAATPTGRQYTVTTAPTLVGGVHALFAAAWDAATDLDAYFRAEIPHLDPADRPVLRALADGLTDQTAARRLGVSLRTYRRRVADLMTKLNADSRFQAGHRAGALGL